MGQKTPWEQHASAAGLPRYNYKALSSTLSLKGFLITCTLDREKSATKEAMEILNKFLSPSVPKTLGTTKVEDVDGRAQLLCSDKDQLSHGECSHSTEPVCQDGSTSSNSDRTEEKYTQNNVMNLKRSRAEFEDCKPDDESSVFLMKMAQKGVISVFWESGRSDDPVTMLTKVLADVENGSNSLPRWCQRMVPVQASCVYSRESLSALVTELVVQYLGKSLPTEIQPLKYAVSFNRRGFEAREVEGSTTIQKEESLDRKACIHLVTVAVSRVAPHTVVDLRTPQMVVIVEVIPFAGAQSSPTCGVTVLPGTLMNTKPRLSVKSLVPAAAFQGKH